MFKYNKSDKINSYGLCEWDYAYHTTEAGNYYGCITHIDNGRIVSVYYKYIYNAITTKYKIGNIRDYCLDRFIRRNFTTDSFEFIIKNGYYGDEPGCVMAAKTAENLDKFIDLLNVDSTNETDLIELVLTEEYGFILDELKNKKWFFDKISLNDIIPAGGMRHTSKKIIDDYTDEKSNGNFTLTCLCQKDKLKYRLIDGYHRYSAAKQLNKKKIITIYCE